MGSASRGYLAPEFIAMAHRGGAYLHANLGIENTLAAFKNSAQLGFTYMETDVHATRDGHVVAFHDRALDRVTDYSGKISDLSLAELKYVLVGGREPIPSVDELLEELPEARFNLDLKSPAAVAPLATTLQRHNAQHRVLVGSFSSRRIRRFRRLLPEVATAASPQGVLALLGPSMGIPLVRGEAFQVPLTHRIGHTEIRLVTQASVNAVHAAGRKLHVWTIESPELMHELIDLGVDGIATDRPDLLRDVLRARGMWSTRSGT